ncbi:MAG: CTP synthase [Bacillota bacterium]|nr:CTP synthase [Bacillota bacterium]
MDPKFIFITGGVVSSLGKGISASSLGMLLKRSGLKVFMLKFDPYLNVDPGTMSPYQHGEVYVTDDGAEADLDLGHYERWLDINLTKESTITSGKIYGSVIDKERRGDYLGACVQVVPHITNEIKERLFQAARVSEADIVIAEIGGTVGDIESLPFLEAIRQMRLELGYGQTMYIHNTLVPYLAAAGESKTKPTQHSVKELLGLGIQPDAIILRSEVPLGTNIRQKVSNFCNVPLNGVFEADDCKLVFELPMKLHEQGIDSYVMEHFGISEKSPKLDDYERFIERVKNLHKKVKIALVGKYVELHDAYLSVAQALKSAGYENDAEVEISWVKAMNVTEENVASMLSDADGILVPGGFGERGADGKMVTIKYARENKIPFLGICFGMQLAVIEFARNVLGIKNATSSEFEPETSEPVIDLLRGQYAGIKLGGTLRLGAYDCRLKPGSKAHEAYGADLIRERHRHRYEFNNAYRELFEKSDLKVVGINPQSDLVEVVELEGHPFFVACQFHPEFTSRLLHSNPLFREFVKASIKG